MTEPAGAPNEELSDTIRHQSRTLLKNVFYEPYQPWADHYMLPRIPPEMEHMDELGRPSHLPESSVDTAPITTNT